MTFDANIRFTLPESLSFATITALSYLVIPSAVFVCMEAEESTMTKVLCTVEVSVDSVTGSMRAAHISIIARSCRKNISLLTSFWKNEKCFYFFCSFMRNMSEGMVCVIILGLKRYNRMNGINARNAYAPSILIKVISVPNRFILLPSSSYLPDHIND
jgi:hypothetical protein